MNRVRFHSALSALQSATISSYFVWQEVIVDEVNEHTLRWPRDRVSSMVLPCAVADIKNLRRAVETQMPGRRLQHDRYQIRWKATKVPKIPTSPLGESTKTKIITSAMIGNRRALGTLRKQSNRSDTARLPLSKSRGHLCVEKRIDAFV